MPKDEWREPTREELSAIESEIADQLAARLVAIVQDIARLYSYHDVMDVLRSLADEIEATIDEELQSILQ